MDIGFYHQSLWDYIDGPGVNRSYLHEILRSPGHGKWKQDNPDDTKSLHFGDAFHAAMLEPDRFRKEYTILPTNCEKGSGTGVMARKAAFEAQCEANGQTIITQKDSDNIRGMAAVLHSNQNALDLLSDGVTELSGYFVDPDFDILVKIRLDFINKKDNIIIDLKSCADARQGLFRKSAYDHGYDMQAWMGLLGVTQITGVPHNDFKFICVESKDYHGLDIWDADQQMLETGYRKYQKAITLYKQCIENDNWPGYDSTSKPLGSPTYAKEVKESGAIYDVY